MEVEAKPKKWGNSIGIIIPKEVVETENITLDDELVLHTEKKRSKKKKKLMKEGYIEMEEEAKKTNAEWEQADAEWL